MAKSILGHHRTITISPTLVIEEYTYVYLTDFDAGRARESHTERRRGWEMKAVEREYKKTKEGHLWICRTVWQKKRHNG